MTDKSPDELDVLCKDLGLTRPKEILNTDEAGEIIGLSNDALRQHRILGTGPLYYKLPGKQLVRYTALDLLRWFAQGRRQSTSEERVA
jgi:hypothetical protein